MADQTIANLARAPLLNGRDIALDGVDILPGLVRPRPGVLRLPPDGFHLEPPPAPPAPQPVPTPVPSPPTPIPAAPAESPFDKLPFPSPGDRVKADDFKALSQSLKLLYELFVLTSTLFGRPYGEVRLLLGSRGYQIARVVTVFGNEIKDASDTSLDSRKVLQVVPAAPGHPAVMLVLAEAVDNRLFTPNLTTGINYTTAVEQVKSVLGNAVRQGPPINTPQLAGLSLADALNMIPK